MLTHHSSQSYEVAASDAANEKKLEWRDVRSKLERTLLKKELEAVQQAFESEDVVNLPEGKTAWRASNALSWFAQTVKDTDRRLQFERIAGQLVA